MLFSTEERYSENELEILRIFWSIDFEFYLIGKQFTGITNLGALPSILKENGSKNSNNGRLYRKVDKITSYDISIEYARQTEIN